MPILSNFPTAGGSNSGPVDLVGVPAGGSTGQVLAKKSTADYDMEWKNPPEGGGVPGVLPDNVVTAEGGATIEVSDGLGSAPHVITITDEEEHPLTAEDILCDDGKTLQEKVTELFTSASDGKHMIASAITGKGVQTEQDASFSEMAENIGQITTGPNTEDATAVSEDILSSKTAYVASGKVTGTMPNQGAVSKNLNAGESYTVPKGFHSGSGLVIANSLSSQTPGTATEARILSGYTAWVNGVKLTGTASQGYTTSDATASASQILSGKTAYISSGKVTGTMTNRGAVSTSLSAGSSYTIPAGYHNGSGRITANSLSSQTSGTATAADIASGKTAWVNGNKLIGTATFSDGWRVWHAKYQSDWSIKSSSNDVIEIKISSVDDIEYADAGILCFDTNYGYAYMMISPFTMTDGAEEWRAMLLAPENYSSSVWDMTTLSSSSTIRFNRVSGDDILVKYVASAENVPTFLFYTPIK